MADQTYTKRILLLVTGLSPQVVTETVYALAVKQQPVWIPTEVHVLTTHEGQERALKELLKKGWFSRLRKDYNLPEIAFDANHLRVVTDANANTLNDIRTETDSEALGDTLAKLITQLTATDDSALHVSIAGGRKTMGFLAGYTLSLLGRPQDRLSHVLVSDGFENLPEFFYPTPYSTIIHTHPPENRPIDTHDADVSLADIPFVRLRAYLNDEKLRQEPNYTRIVNAAQIALGGPTLKIDVENRRILAGSHELTLTTATFALYTWLAYRRLADMPAVSCPIEGHPDKVLGHELLKVTDDLLTTRLQTQIEDNGLSAEQFVEWKSRLHSRLRQQLGQTAASPYLITKAQLGYGLYGLPANQIHFTEIEA